MAWTLLSKGQPSNRPLIPSGRSRVMTAVVSECVKSISVEKNTRLLLILVSLLCLFTTLILLSLIFPVRESLTYDEVYYFTTGDSILSGKPSEARYDNAMPVMALYPIASAAIRTIIPVSILPSDSRGVQQFYLAKSATILVSLLLAFYVFLWGRYLYGVHAALLAVLLYVLDPN